MWRLPETASCYSDGYSVSKYSRNDPSSSGTAGDSRAQRERAALIMTRESANPIFSATIFNTCLPSQTFQSATAFSWRTCMICK